MASLGRERNIAVLDPLEKSFFFIFICLFKFIYL